jgi:putative endonuclease
LEVHNLGKGAKYTRYRIPVELLGTSSEMTKSEALKLELRIKRMPAARKCAEIGMAV